MKKLILSALAGLFISKAQAQVTISAVGGTNVSGYTAYQYGSSYSDQYKMRPGFCVGALIDLQSKKELSLQSGLLYKLNGYRTDPIGAEQYVSYRISTLEVPVKVTYSFPNHNGSRFFIGVGPYIAVNVAASAHRHFYSTDIQGNPIELIDDVVKIGIGGKNELPVIDAGAGMNFGYYAAKGFLIGLQGQYGLVNQGDAMVKLHNYNFGVVAGYSFKLKKHMTKTEQKPQAN